LGMGTGLSNLMATGGAGSGVDLRTFIFPGVCAMSVMFTAMFSAGSIVWDREFGFLREMLVAPVSRSAIVIGKCIGGALVATLQGAVIVALAGLAGVPYDPLLLAELVAMMFLGAFALTGFGVMMAARITQMQSFLDRKSTRLNSSHVKISYAVFCLKKKITSCVDSTFKI